MVDKKAISDWLDKNYMETGLLPYKNESLKAAAMMYPVGEDFKDEAIQTPLMGLEIFLDQQFKNRFFTDILGTKIARLKEIQNWIHENEDSSIRLHINFEVYKDDAEDVKSTFKNITANLPKLHVEDEVEKRPGDLEWPYISITIEGATMDEVVSNTNGLLKSFHAYTGTRLPVDTILLEPSMFSQSKERS